jgi:hypothetical protein
MDPYMFGRNKEGIHIINVAKAWEKLMIAARIIAAIPNPKDILVNHILLFSLNANHWRLPLIFQGKWGLPQL